MINNLYDRLFSMIKISTDGLERKMLPAWNDGVAKWQKFKSLKLSIKCPGRSLELCKIV